MEVRWRQPTAVFAIGQVYKTLAGEAVIDVSPTLTGRDKLFVFLEEVAHIRFEFSAMEAKDMYDQPSGSYRLHPAIVARGQASPTEVQAKRQANEWLEYADKNVHMWGDELKQRLLALTTWQSPDELKVRKIIEQAVKEVVAAAIEKKWR